MNKMLKLLFTSILTIPSLSLHAANGLTTEQEAQVKKLIRETLINNPDILEDAAKALQEKQRLAETIHQKKLIDENRKALYDDPTSPIIGNIDAPIKLVYFTDYNCPYCKRFDPQLLALQEKYPQQVNLIIKPIPFLGEGSKIAAENTLSIWQKDPQQFLKIHHALMNKKTRIDATSVNTILTENNLSNFKITEQGKQALERNLKLAQTLNIRGTPATIIGDQIIPGAIPSEAIEMFIQQKISQNKTK